MTAMSQIEFVEKNYIICICFKLGLALNKSGIECINFHSNSEKINVHLQNIYSHSMEFIILLYSASELPLHYR